MLDLSFNAAIESLIEKEIEVLVEHDLMIKHLVVHISKVIGLSDTSSSSIESEVGNVARFSNRKQYLKYVGCAPAQHISGEVSRAGHLSKRANKFARYAFLQAGRIVTQSVSDDSAIKEFARKQLNAHWNDKKLVYANVGIKIALVVYALMVKGTDYDPKYKDPTKKITSLLETTSTMQESAVPAKKLVKPKPFVLKTIQRKTKYLIRYIEKTWMEPRNPENTTWQTS